MDNMASNSPPSHLILVCCHAIYLGGPTKGTSESEWLLANFQRDEVPTFTSHLQTGLSLLSQDPCALLVLSGSKTRPEIDKSEAQSYLDLAVEHDFWGLADDHGMRVRERILCEEQALDSFANLLFSVMRFWRATAAWPTTLTVVSHEFKRRRFMDCHVPALRLAPHRVRFVGIDPCYMQRGHASWDQARCEAVVEGEHERGFMAWREDGSGRGAPLRQKRAARNPWCVGQELFCDEDEKMRSLVRCTIVDSEEFLIEGEPQPWE
ncbi:dihydrofolate synthetase [Phlyctema vagabunda]|uniref:Dihydrofolate synthetase n=1 Tax=Phlyctema vagabunda TaxID=108571 RepID=A0ABR4PMR3_9HELO